MFRSAIVLNASATVLPYAVLAYVRCSKQHPFQDCCLALGVGPSRRIPRRPKTFQRSDGGAARPPRKQQPPDERQDPKPIVSRRVQPIRSFAEVVWGAPNPAPAAFSVPSSTSNLAKVTSFLKLYDFQEVARIFENIRDRLRTATPTEKFLLVVDFGGRIRSRPYLLTHAL